MNKKDICKLFKMKIQNYRLKSKNIFLLLMIFLKNFLKTKRELFVAPDPNDLAIAVKGLTKRLLMELLICFHKKSKQCMSRMKVLLQKKKLMIKRKDFLDKAKEMDKEGTISIEDILGGGEMIE